MGWLWSGVLLWSARSLVEESGTRMAVSIGRRGQTAGGVIDCPDRSS